jgi:hypothetical protein
MKKFRIFTLGRKRRILSFGKEFAQLMDSAVNLSILSMMYITIWREQYLIPLPLIVKLLCFNLGITVPKRENCTLRLKPISQKYFSDTYFP